jgi:hypothetical protein
MSGRRSREQGSKKSLVESMKSRVWKSVWECTKTSRVRDERRYEDQEALSDSGD